MSKKTPVTAREQGLVLLGMIKKGTHKWPTVTWDPESGQVKVGSDPAGLANEETIVASGVIGTADSRKDAKSLVQSKAAELGQPVKIF
ncbi:MAG: hypothetical protein AAB487_02175 [Patescibacteria group bacterium]